MKVKLTCECSDSGCPVKHGSKGCRKTAAYIVYRVDMADETGTPMCQKCAEDAMDSGLFNLKEI
jgi:hypothetical protein